MTPVPTVSKDSRGISDAVAFLAEAARDFRTTGAIAPSSKRLAGLLTDRLKEEARKPLAILEVGAGTGSVTRALLDLLSPGSCLDVVEANPKFAQRLRHLTRTHPRLNGSMPQVQVHQSYIQDLRTERRYDLIVSGLPFTNFEPEQVDDIMRQYLSLLHPGGTLTYFAYIGTRRLRTLTSRPAQAARHAAVERVLAGYQHAHATGCWSVWGNLPPAKVWQLRAPRTGVADPLVSPRDTAARTQEKAGGRR
ncbi:methyltransferase domain-containing protein [Streptomyces sp. NPDC002262]|uniref:class I SAM-dependent methyltransferase n=1 Tax=Streptomyces sp. NPDC002262 TaxID=3154414 RepID=UPI003326A559